MTATLSAQPAGKVHSFPRPAQASPGTDPEVQLLAALRAGDEQAYETFVRRYAGRMLVVARRFLRCEEDSADAVQDAFLSAFQALPSFAGQCQLGTWLHRIVINACLMRLRSRSRRPTVSIEDLLPRFAESGHHALPVAPWSEEAHSRAALAETQAQVRACIDRLPDPYRTVLLLRDMEGFDTDETAHLMGTTRAVVKTRLHRARQALRTLLAPFFRAEESPPLAPECR
jgi:RNA polymerase sigma-70 factor (ECF subfamily)